MKKHFKKNSQVLKLIPILICFLSLCAETKAQIVIPPSPESSALIRNVTHPAETSTGTPAISCPLHLVNSSTLSLPIELIYQTSGLKVQDIPGWCGLGWYLSCGGRVTRVVKQKPDEAGYCDGDGVTANTAGYWNASSVASWGDGNRDGEPDLFFFEISGRKGCFVLDPQGNAYTIPYQRLKINWVNRTYFEIYDEFGIKYVFGQTVRENSNATVNTGSGVRTMQFVSTWFLESIEHIDGDKITFSYETDTGRTLSTQYYNERYPARITGSSMPSGVTPVNLNTTVSISAPKYLKTVGWRSGKLEFLSSLQSNSAWGRKLDEIKIYSLNDEYLHSIKFVYTSFNSTESRLKLDEITRNSAVDQHALFAFDYENTLSLPARNTRSYDHWGYFNNISNSVSWPSFVYNGRTIAGANRNATLAGAKTGMLKRIRNALKGYTEYEYELHQVPGTTMGGLRLKSETLIPESGHTGYTKLFLYHALNDSTDKSGLKRIPDINYVSYVPGTSDGYCTVSTRDMNEILGLNGSPVSYSTVIMVYPNGSKEAYHYQFECDIASEVTDYSVSRSLTPSPVIFPPTTRFWRRGLLTTLLSYNNQGVEQEKNEYIYTVSANAKRIIYAYLPIVLPVSGQTNPPKLNGKYEWVSQPVFLNEVRTSGLNTIRKTKTISYDTNYLLPVEEITIIDGYDRYKYVSRYPFSYSVSNASPSATNAYALRKMLERNRIDQPVETVSYKNDKVTGASLNEFKVISTDLSTEAIVADKKRELALNYPLSSTFTFYNALTATADSRYKKIMYLENYDRYGNLIQLREEYQNSIALVYGYNGTLPIATVENALASTGSARTNQVFYTSFEEHPNAIDLGRAKTGRKALKQSFTISTSNFKFGKYVLTYWKSTDNGKSWSFNRETFTLSGNLTIGSTAFLIDEVSIIPENARINTTAFLPGIGKIADTDQNGSTVYYQYDSFGRLILEQDNSGDKLKDYEYKFK